MVKLKELPVMASVRVSAHSAPLKVWIAPLV
jgi:hypothetical protein